MLYRVECDRTDHRLGERRATNCRGSGTNLDLTSSARITRQLRPFGLLPRPNSLLYGYWVHVVDVMMVRGEVDVDSVHSLKGGEEGGRIG